MKKEKVKSAFINMSGSSSIKKTGIMAAVFLVSLCFLVFSGFHLKKVQRQMETAFYQTEEPVSGELAKKIVCGDPENEDERNMIFGIRKSGMSVQNTEPERAAVTDVLIVCGSSALLYPCLYPLNTEDETGCLLGEQTAWELFLSPNPVGAQITYEGNLYEIRGIIPKENLLVIEGGKGETYSRLAVKEAGLYERNMQISQLQNLYGIRCTELPLRFLEKKAKCLVVLSSFCLYCCAAAFLCRNQKLSQICGLKGYVCFIGIIGLFIGFLYILSLSVYTLPDQVSDLSWWSRFFQNEWTEYRSYLDIPSGFPMTYSMLF